MNQHRFIRRRIEPELRQSIRRSPITALLGPRRIGKTTLLRKIYREFADAVLIDLEDRRMLRLIRESPEIFRQSHVEPYDIILLDNFHHVAHGGRILRLILERHPDKKIVLTGSLSLERTVGALGLVRQQIASHVLMPLSFAELVRWQDPRLGDRLDEWAVRLEEARFHDILPEIPADLNLALKQIFERYLVQGGYPQLHQRSANTSLCEQLTAIRGCFRGKVQGDPSPPSREDEVLFLRFLAVNSGRALSPEEIARALHCDGQHAFGLLQYWEAAFVVRRIHPFDRDVPSGVDKVLFTDPGLRSAWLDRFAPYQERRDRAALLETGVAAILTARGLNLSYWPAETDGISFVMDDGLERTPIAMLAGRTPDCPEEAFRSFVERYEPPRLVILNASIAASRRMGSSRICLLPYWLI
ncbi:MAG: ATP-binding protein [Acidobacteria bacterium]|nr:ATP-binding protein [Acidobacteriota bacterium]